MIKDLLFLPSTFIWYPPTVQSQGPTAVLKNNNPGQFRSGHSQGSGFVPVSLFPQLQARFPVYLLFR